MIAPTAKGETAPSTKRGEHVAHNDSSHVSREGPAAPSQLTPSPPAATSSSLQQYAAAFNGNVTAQTQQRNVSQATQQAVTELNDIRERRNWLIHVLYTRQEFMNCLTVIEAQLRDTEGTCEYALYVKGLLKRMEGDLSESLALLQAAVLVSPENVETRKQFGRALFLLGRHEEALEAFRESQALSIAKGRKDWEVELHLGLCLVFLGDLDGAVNAFVRSLGLQRIDSTFLHLGRTLVKLKSYDSAIQIYQEALMISPTNPDLQAALGQLYLKTGAVQDAFHCFGTCLSEDPAHLKALVAAMSIAQTEGNYEMALVKYRIAVTKAPDSPQLWNNIGVCFFAQHAKETSVDAGSHGGTTVHSLYAAVACLRKAIILAPFEWIANYNLGIAFLALGRYLSAFHYISAAISLNSKYAPAYMYLGVCLSLMNDIDNAVLAYEKALSIEDDVVFRVNYATTLLNSNLLPESAMQLRMALPTLEKLSNGELTALSPRLPVTLDALKTALQGVAPGKTQEQPLPSPNTVVASDSAKRRSSQPKKGSIPVVAAESRERTAGTVVTDRQANGRNGAGETEEMREDSHGASPKREGGDAKSFALAERGVMGASTESNGIGGGGAAGTGASGAFTGLSSIPVFHPPQGLSRNDNDEDNEDMQNHGSQRRHSGQCQQNEGSTSSALAAGVDKRGGGGGGGGGGGTAAAEEGESTTLHAFHSPSMTLASVSASEEAMTGDGAAPRSRRESSQYPNEEDLIVNTSVKEV